MVAVTARPATPFRDFVAEILALAAAAGGQRAPTRALGPLRLEVVAPDPAMSATFARGLAGHLRDSAESPSLTLHLLVGPVGGVAPPPAWPLPVTTHDHQRRRHLDAEVAISCWNEGAVWQVLDRRSGRGAYWARSAAAIPEWDYGAPFRTLLAWALADLGLSLLHGAGIGRADAGLLVAGAGGAGKSSTTLVALREGGLATVGDDFVAVEAAPRPRALALFRTLKLEQSALSRLDVPEAWVANPGRPAGEKARLYPAERLPASSLESLPLLALAVPVITGERQTLARRVDGGRLLRALAPSSLFLVPGRERERFQSVAAIVQQLPCFELSLGSDPGALAEALHRLLEELSRG